LPFPKLSAVHGADDGYFISTDLDVQDTVAMVRVKINMKSPADILVDMMDADYLSLEL
jgi:hypothetical protein